MAIKDTAEYQSFRIAVDMITQADMSNHVISEVIRKNIFSAHFAQPLLDLSTSFDYKYDPMNDKWESCLHFRGIKKHNCKRVIDTKSYKFKGLWDLLENDLLKKFTVNGLVSDKCMIDKDSSEEYFIKSKEPIDIIWLNIILLDCLDLSGIIVTADQERIQRWIGIERATLPTIQGHVRKMSKRAHHGNKNRPRLPVPARHP